MEQYIIKGGNPLVGDVTISGAKNAALGILAASIMTDDDVVIDNLPDVRDINVLLEAIQEIGARVDRIDRHTVKINGSNISEVSVDDEYIRRIRASYYFIGALLGKYKSAQVPLPGGCNIGSRPIDQHIKGFRALGAEVTIERGAVIAHAIDLVASRYGVFCQGCDEVALTLLDVLDYMEKIPMVTAYKLSDGTTTTRFPMGEALDTAQPVVEYLPGWHCDITAARKWEDLPKEAQNYVEYLEKAVGCKITYISVGAEREAYIHHVV